MDNIIDPFFNILPVQNHTPHISYYSSSPLIYNNNTSMNLDEYNNNTPSTPAISLYQNNNNNNFETMNKNNIPQNNEVLNNISIPEINLEGKNFKNELKPNLENQTNKSTAMTSLNELNLPKINNIVSTASLSCKLNLNAIANQLKNITYNPKRFSGAIYNLKEPKATCLIFYNGQIVCLGARTEIDSATAIRKMAKIIKHFGYDVKFSNFKIQNIVGSFDFQSPISITKLYLKNKTTNNNIRVTYEPEMFPGLIYRMEKPKITLLIFKSGKIILTGGKKTEEIFEAYNKIKNILRNFRVEQ